MLQKPKSLVLLNFCDGLYGGIESFLLNAFYCLDREKYDVTFLTCGRSTYDMYRNDIVSRGGHIEEIPILPSDNKTKIQLYRALYRYFKRNKPDIVHVNSGTLSLQLIASLAAKRGNVNRVIIHSHNFRTNPSMVSEIIKIPLKWLIWVYGDSFLACSKGAALWMFPTSIVEKGKVNIIPNGIDTKKFAFSENKRFIFRREFNLGNKLVIGNIGRFQTQKNHFFMIKIMQEVVKIDKNAMLLLVGEGELKQEIKELVVKQKLQDNVVFLGERNDMDAFLSAIDVFILPSIYEGFGIAAVEAEASGAKTILSQSVPQVTNVSGNAIYLSIDKKLDEKEWANRICDKSVIIDRNHEYKKIYNAGYDVHLCYRKLREIYDEDVV